MGGRPRWGVAEGIQAGLWHPGGDARPRGLIRLYWPTGGDPGAGEIVNFLAVEPVVAGQGRGFSELETSRHDGRPGLRIWACEQPLLPDSPHLPEQALSEGEEEGVAAGVSALSVTLRLEPFANGAHPRLVLRFRSDRPHEVAIRTEHEADSAPMRFCTVTATMGNFARLRRLHLRSGTVRAAEVFGDYRGTGFTADAVWEAAELCRTPTGDILVAATGDEEKPHAVRPFPGRDWWWWSWPPLTQYWRKEAGTFGPDLHLRVNARRVYWGTQTAIPGGLSFENIELREAYRPGQVVIWGISPLDPDALLAPGPSRRHEPSGAVRKRVPLGSRDLP
ncbi:MAG: hypothetical protein JXR77_04950 [Lentisphaeria bacterium]|nr:hypothetical protein [Lentisphaeria bacterium]